MAELSANRLVCAAISSTSSTMRVISSDRCPSALILVDTPSMACACRAAPWAMRCEAPRMASAERETSTPPERTAATSRPIDSSMWLKASTTEPSSSGVTSPRAVKSPSEARDTASRSLRMLPSSRCFCSSPTISSPSRSSMAL